MTTCKCETDKESYTICLSCQEIDKNKEEAKINSIGFTSKGRQILNDQEHIFVEGLVDCEKTIYNELSTEAKLEIWKSKHNRKGGN